MGPFRHSIFKRVLFVFILIISFSLVNFPHKTLASGIAGAYFAAGKNLLLIAGSGFGGAQGGSTVTVDGTSLGAATSWSDTHIYYSAPAKNSGTVTVNISGGSIYTSTITRLSTYTSYPSDPDQNSSNLISYYPFDSNFNDVKGSNNLNSQNLKLYGSGQFGGKYEAIQTFSNPSVDWTAAISSYRNIIKIGSQTLLTFNDGTAKYTISSDNGVTWSTPVAMPAYNFMGLPSQMENGEWLYLKLPPFPFHTFQFCHATGVTIDNIWNPPSLNCLASIDFATLSNNWDWNGTTNTGVYYQWQYEYLGNGRVIWPIYKYFDAQDHHGAGIIRSLDYGHTWDFKPIFSGRTVALSLAAPITAGDTTITLSDTTGMYASGTVYINDGVNKEIVSYGAISGNTLQNVRRGVANANIGEYIADNRMSNNSPGVQFSYAVPETTIDQGSINGIAFGEPTVVLDPNNSNHLIMFERAEGASSSYIYKCESSDFGATWTDARTIYLGDPTTAEPVRGNNNWAYWTANAGGSQGRIYIFTRHNHGTKYFYSDDSGATWSGNNAECSTTTENNYTIRVGNTWLLANNQNNIVEAADGSGLWLYWGIAIDEASLDATGAGDSDYNDTYIQLSTYNGKPSYQGITHSKWLWWDSTNSRWVLSINTGSAAAYVGTGTTLPADPWSVSGGVAPAPTLSFVGQGTGTDRGALGKLFLSYNDSTSGKNLSYAYASYSSSYNLSQYSIDFWANIRQTHRNTDGTIVSRMSADGAKANYDIKIIGNGANQNKIQFWQYNDLTSSWDAITSTTALSNDTWYHVVATYDGAKMRLYINGILESSGDSTATHSGTEKLQIGYDQSSDEKLFRGQLDNLKIYNKALSDSEVLARYNWEQPVISSISPSSVQVGDTITISGTGFGANQGQNSVLINGQAVGVTGWSDTQITVTAPNLPAGTYTLKVVVSGYSSNEKSIEILATPIPSPTPTPTTTTTTESSSSTSLTTTLKRFRRCLSNILQETIDSTLKIFITFGGTIYDLSQGMVKIPTQIPIFSGDATAQAAIDIYIASEPQQHYQTTAQADGHWVYELQEPLAFGLHEIYITATDSQNKIRTSETFYFTIEKPASTGGENHAEQNKQSLLKTLEIASIAIIALIVLFLILFAKKRRHAS
jgi:hypothetical protein